MRLINPNTKDPFVAPRCGARGQTLLQEEQLEFPGRQRGAKEGHAGSSTGAGHSGFTFAQEGKESGEFPAHLSQG